MALNNDMRTACFNVQARADGIAENTEDLMIQISTDPDLPQANIIIRQPTTTLIISKN